MIIEYKLQKRQKKYYAGDYLENHYLKIGLLNLYTINSERIPINFWQDLSTIELFRVLFHSLAYDFFRFVS